MEPHTYRVFDGNGDEIHETMDLPDVQVGDVLDLANNIDGELMSFVVTKIHQTAIFVTPL